MTNSSPEYWSIADLDGTNETSLHQWGWSVTTVGGSRYDLPPRRGSDMTVAYRPGQIHRRKLPDARQVTLLMFMVGWDPATGLAPDDQMLQWNDNWDFLRRLVFRHSMLPDQRLRLYRRWFLTVPTFPTSRTGDFCIQGDPGVPAPGKRLLEAFANAEMVGQMQPSMTGRFRSEFQLDFTLSDPYFYGPQVTFDIFPGVSYDYVWNDGHDVAGAGYMQVDLHGPLKNPVITNYSTNPDSWVKYAGTINAGETVRLITNKFTAEKLVSSGNQNRISLISSYGARWWVSLVPGDNKLKLTSDAVPVTIPPQLGKATITFRPPYV